MAGHDDTVSAVALSRNGLGAVSGSEDGTLRIWKTESEEEVANIADEPDKDEDIYWITPVAFAHDDIHVVSGSHDGTVRIWKKKRWRRGGQDCRTQSLGHFCPILARQHPGYLRFTQ